MPRANFHLDVAVDESDPFAAPLLDVRQAEPVALSDLETLRHRLLELVDREGQLAGEGVKCSIKDRPDSCCSACPLRGSRTAFGIRELCKLGIAQERALMTIIAADA